MRTALSQRQVRGTTACVRSVDVSKRTLDVPNNEGIRSYHNFEYETSGVRVLKAYRIGPGKLILFDGLFKKH